VAGSLRSSPALEELRDQHQAYLREFEVEDA
jgi:hypothetical protein